MLPDRVSNPGPLTYESGALPIALRGPASPKERIQSLWYYFVKTVIFAVEHIWFIYMEFGTAFSQAILAQLHIKLAIKQ